MARRLRFKNFEGLHGQSRTERSGWKELYSNSHSSEHFVSPCIVTAARKEIKQ